MTEKFTKGTWYLQKFTDVCTNIIRCNDGKGFETLYIANLHGEGCSNRENAQLISAAPDMYNALKSSLQMLEQHLSYRNANNIQGGNVFLECTIDEVKKALNKATEETIRIEKSL